MCVPLETESAPAKLAPHQHNRCGSNYYQRHRLLPIHTANIAPNQSQSTNDSTQRPHLSCLPLDKMRKPILRDQLVPDSASILPFAQCSNPIGAATLWRPSRSLVIGTPLHLPIPPPAPGVPAVRPAAGTTQSPWRLPHRGGQAGPQAQSGECLFGRAKA